MLTRKKILEMRQEPIMKPNVMITAHMTRPNHSSTTSRAKLSNVQRARCRAPIGVKNAKSTLRLSASRRTVVESEYNRVVIYQVKENLTHHLTFSALFFSYRGRPQNNRGGPRTNGYYYHNRYNNQNNYRPRNNNRNQTNAGQSTGVPPQPSQPKPVGTAAAS